MENGQIYPVREKRIVGVQPEQRGIFYTGGYPGYYRPAPRYVEYGNPSEDTARRKVSNYFQFLDKDSTNSDSDHEPPKRRREIRSRRRTSLLNRIFAIVFCVSELLLGAALIAFGSARLSVYQKSLNSVLPPLNATDARQTATVTIGNGVFVVAASLTGIGGFALQKRGLKMAHVIFAVISLIMLMLSVVVTSHEIGDQNFMPTISSSISSQQFGMDVALLVLVSVALFILLQTTLTQSCYGLVPSRLRIRSWPISHLIFVLVTVIFSTTLFAVASVGLHQAVTIQLTSNPSQQNTVYLLLKIIKRDVCVASLVTGFYIWVANFWALTAVFTRSRPLSLSAVALYIPGAYHLLVTVLSAYTTVIPSLNAPGAGPDQTTVYYLIFGNGIIVAILLFITIPVVAVSIFKK